MIAPQTSKNETTKAMFELNKKFDKVDSNNCFISEITLAEIKFGVEYSGKPETNRKALEDFLTEVPYT